MARIPIIFGCAEDHELPVAAVADAVQREGYPVEVTTGIDHDPSALASATDRIRGPALFVLCRSEALGRSAALRVEGLLSARKGPRHHVITVDVSKRVPTSAVPAILEAAARLGEDRSRARDEDSGQFMREVVVPTSVAAAPGAVISDRPSRARWAEPMRELVEEPRGISEEALGLHDDDTDVYDADAYDLPPPEPDVLISTDPDSVELARGTAGIPELVDEDDGIPPRASDPELVVPGAPQGLPWEGSGPVEVERVTPRVRADPRAEADDRPLPSASTPIEIGEEPAEYEPPPEPRRSGARVLLLLMAAAGMAGIVMMAVLHDSGFGGGAPEPVVHQRGLPGTATPTVEPGADAGAGSSDGAAAGSGDATGGAAIAGSTGAVEASASTGEGETAGPLEESGGVAASSDEGGSTGAEGGGTDEGDPGPSAGLGDDAAGDDAAGDDAAGNDGGGSAMPLVPPPPNTAPSASQLEAAIAAAIAAGRMQEHGELLVLPAGTETMTWDEASARCRRRKAEGMRSWRLPSKGELVELRKAKLLPPGTYWSRAAVGGDEAYAFDAASGRMNVWLKMEPNARALCVRKRP